LNEKELKKTVKYGLYLSIVMFILFLLGFLSDPNLLYLCFTLSFFVGILAFIFIRIRGLK